MESKEAVTHISEEDILDYLTKGESPLDFTRTHPKMKMVEYMITRNEDGEGDEGGKEVRTFKTYWTFYHTTSTLEMLTDIYSKLTCRNTCLLNAGGNIFNLLVNSVDRILRQHPEQYGKYVNANTTINDTHTLSYSETVALSVEELREVVKLVYQFWLDNNKWTFPRKESVETHFSTLSPRY